MRLPQIFPIPDKGHFFSKFHYHFDFQSSIPCLKLSIAKCCILHSRQGFVVPDKALLKKLKNFMGETLLNNKVLLQQFVFSLTMDY